jgi:hypothetical protein
LIAAAQAETIVGHGDKTNRISIDAGQVAIIQSAIVTPWAVADRFARWESGTNHASLEFNSPGEYPSNQTPLILAGPGSLAVSYPHCITFQKIRLTNAATVILTNAPFRIPVKASQRVALFSAYRWGTSREFILYLLQPGAEFTEQIKDTQRLPAWLSIRPLVIDGPWDVVLWAPGEVRVLTYILQGSPVMAPIPVLNNHAQPNAIELQASTDGEAWDVNAVIIPESEGWSFFRLSRAVR